MADVLILGGGFGGLETAHRLRSSLSDEHSITLIDRRERFTVGAAKLWDLVGLRPLEQSSGALQRLRDKGIDFVRADITAIDPETRTVATSEGTHKGDFLVVALGAAFNPRQVEALKPPAFNLYDPESVPAARAALEEVHQGRVVVVVMGMPYKCPPAPYEASFLIDHYLRAAGRRDDVELDVYTVQPSPLPVAGPEASARVAQTLEQRGIGLHTDHKEAAIDGAAREVRFGNGTTSGFDLLLGVPQHVPPEVVARSALAGKSGWIEPDPATLGTAFEHVFAIGDCTAVANAIGEIPKAGIFAESEGRVVASRIIAEIEGREGATFDGHGYCFLEFAGGEAAKVEGDFFAEPRPDVELKGPDASIFAEKEAFVAERLEAWF